MFFNLERVRDHARQAETEDLLDRVTVFRADMEEEALTLFEEELRCRGVTAADIEAHARRRAETGLWQPEGHAVRCSDCARPAVEEYWGWHRLWGLLPLFPRRFRCCTVHKAKRAVKPTTGH